MVYKPHDHTNRIGASTAAAVLGYDKFVSPVEAWMEITGRAVPEASDSLREAAYWGSVFEEPIAQRYANEYSFTVEKIPEMLVHQTLPWLTCHPDRIVREDERGVQIKCRDRTLRSKWDNDIPEAELIQVTIENLMLQQDGFRAEQMDIPVLFGGNHLVVYEVDFKEELAVRLVRALMAWWNKHVVAGDEPEPRDEADCRALWAVARGQKTISVPAMTLVSRDVQIAHETRRLDEERKALRLELRKELGKSEELVVEVNDPAPKIKALARWPMTMGFDEEAFVRDNPKVAAKHMKLSRTSLQKAERKLYQKYRTLESRGKFDVTNYAKEYVAEELKEGHEQGAEA